MKDNWSLKLAAFLHDPPDKPISISGHKVRRDSFLFTPLGLKYADYATIVERADHVSSAMQRMNVPKEADDIVIDFTRDDKGLWPIFKHPLSSAQKEISIRKSIESSSTSVKRPEQRFLIDNHDCGISKLRDRDPKTAFLKVWRLLSEGCPIYWDFPADTRIPDHTIWDHMDVTSALAPCVEDGVSFLGFKMGPVQEFIESSGKFSDLWAGSHLLSYLSFSGIRRIVEELGPDALIFPYLRSQPFMDWWLSTQGILDTPEDEKLRVSNIPHRFLAVVPRTKAKGLSTSVKKSVLDAWTKIGDDTLKRIENEGIAVDDELKRNWDRQIADAFSTTTQVLDWVDPLEHADAVWSWFDEIKERLPGDLTGKYEKWLEHYRHPSKGVTTGFEPNAGSLYGLYFELISALVDQKSRFFKHTEEPEEMGGEEGGRCSLCGIRNPIRRKDQKAKEFWKEMKETFQGLFKPKERFCAVCTVKRFYRDLNPMKARTTIKSIATIALTDFINGSKRNETVKRALNDFLKYWNEQFAPIIGQDPMTFDDIEGEWLYEESYTPNYLKRNCGVDAAGIDLDKMKQKLKDFIDAASRNGIPSPRKYYSILLMDGDKMGRKLRGDEMPKLKCVIHPAFREKLAHAGAYERILDSPRILNPNIHMAISRALLEFSVNLVSGIVRKHNGLLVYSGGDDVLALLPAEKALDAAREINDTFGTDFREVGNRNVMLLGKGSTMSAGIVFAHYKHPLYDALEKAREACKKAKSDYGRSAFVLTDIRRSGQISIAGGKWETIDNLMKFVNLMLKEKEEGGLSPRFVYRLLQDIDSFGELDNAGKMASLKYLLDRHLGEEIEKRKELLEDLSRSFLDATDTISINNPMQETAKNIKILYTIYKEG